MQTLGLSDSELRTESRLKSLFWPSIRTATDVDYLGTQGYWVCALVAVVSFILSVVTNHPIAGFFVLVYYYFGGVGVREHSLYASAAVLAMYVLDSVASFPGGIMLRVFLSALLLSNFRATWIASQWKPESEEATQPMRLSETWGDKFADQIPRWLWPKVRLGYYVFSVGFLALALLGVAMMFARRHS